MAANGLAFTDTDHVQSATWAAVDQYTLSHTHPHTRPNHAALEHALKHSRAGGLPDIATSPIIAKYFALQCRAKGVRHALELGTLGALTSIWLATENPALRVTTLELDPRHAAVAQANLDFAGLGRDRVEIRVGAALDLLPGLLAEIRRGEREPLGFVYIDADKVNNWRYLDMVIEGCEPGAVIYVDNIVRGGRLIDPKEQRTSSVKGAKEVVERVGKDERVDGMVMQFVSEKGYDGFVMAVVR